MKTPFKSLNKNSWLVVILHLLQNTPQADLCLTGRTPKLLHLREQSPIF